MAEVDPNDDTIRRFVVRHYRYDPLRRERRHVVVAAFDNEQQFLAAIEQIRADIEQRRQRGEDVDAREHASGLVYEPGYLRRAANGHLLLRAIKRGVAALRLDELELPTNMALLRRRRERPPR